MIGKKTPCFLASAAVLFGAASAVHATVLANWTFETSVPTTAGPHAAEAGVNAGAGSPATGFHSNGAAVYSNPVGNGSFESFSSNTWTVSDYYQFATSTVGYTNLTFSWNQTRSSTGPGTFDLEYSTDGTNFSTLVDDYIVPAISWSSGTPDVTLTTVFGPIAVPAAADNQPTVYFRLSSQETTAASGTNRVDNIVIEGIPEPATLLLGALSFVGLVLPARARRLAV